MRDGRTDGVNPPPPPPPPPVGFRRGWGSTMYKCAPMAWRVNCHGHQCCFVSYIMMKDIGQDGKGQTGGMTIGNWVRWGGSDCWYRQRFHDMIPRRTHLDLHQYGTHIADDRLNRKLINRYVPLLREYSRSVLLQIMVWSLYELVMNGEYHRIDIYHHVNTCVPPLGLKSLCHLWKW